MAAVVALLPAAEVGAWARGLVLVCCVLGPPTADCAVRATKCLNRDDMVRRVQRIENACVPALLVWASLPLPVLVAVVVCLAGANVALGGGRGLWRALMHFLLGALSGVLLGWLLGRLFGTGVDWQLGVTPGVTNTAIVSVRTWWLSLAMITAFALALSDVGFRLTQRLDSHREQLQERAALLGYFAPQGLPVGSQARTLADGLQARQWLTVCVIDLVAFTAASAGLAPETVAQVLDDLLDTVVEEANHNGGTLDKFTGDGALLFFADADRAQGVESAVNFTNSLLAKLPVLNDSWHSYGLLNPLAMRAGVAAGYCSLGQCGTRDVRAYTLVGPSVALAERLQVACRSNAALLCSVSARLLRRARGQLPDKFVVDMRAGYSLTLEASMLEPKGFSRVRAYHASAKVHSAQAASANA